MIKVGNEYLEYEGMPDVVRQVKTADTIDAAGDFSYSFSLPMTSNNIRILRIGINRTDSLVNYRIPAVIEDNGTQLYTGYLRIESVKSMIDVSFFSGNSEWFADLEGKFLYNLDLSHYKLPVVNTDPSVVIPGSWDNTEGITFPLIDTGRLQQWSTSLPRLGNWTFLAMVYVKNVMPAIFQQNGYKISGELLNESRYVNAVVGVDDEHQLGPTFIRARSAFVGKGDPQTVGTTPGIITFTDKTYPYYVGDKNGWDGSRYRVTEGSDIAIEVNLTLDASVSYTIELYKNGSPDDTITGTGSTINAEFNNGNAFPADEGDYYEVYMYISAGTVNITDGDISIKLIAFNYTYPQFLLGEMTQSEFVRSIFRMFNVVASYDPYTKTVTANLFKNIDKVQQDLSEYIDGVELDFIETIDEFSKNNIFQYDPADDPDLLGYNESEIAPYGGGNISPQSQFLDGQQEFDVAFSSSYSRYNDLIQGNVMGLGMLEFSNNTAYEIISVADDGSGFALFETSEPHGFRQTGYVRIANTNTGQYEGLGLIADVPTDTTFVISLMPFDPVGSVGFSGTAYTVNTTVNLSSKVFIMLNIPNMLVSDFSFNSTINYGGTDYDRVAYAYFVKSDLGLPIDDYKEVLAFQNPVENGFTGITLFDSYYSHTMRYLNDPVKLKGRFLLPHRVFTNLDLTKSIRVKTPDFNVLAFSSKLTGHNPCEIELIKL